MALINCPECGTRLSDKADKCPNCAYPIRANVNVGSEGCFLQTMNFGCVLIVMLIAGLILFMIIVGLFG